MNKGLSPSRQMWNRAMTALVWASAVLVMVLVAGIIGMVLVRGIPHISWKFLSTTASVLKKTDGILPAILPSAAGQNFDIFSILHTVERGGSLQRREKFRGYKDFSFCIEMCF